MPNEYTLSDLVKLTGVSSRTVRYYIQSGLLPAPTGQGPAARYSEAHLDRLRLIRRLQATHLPLAEIRRQLEALPEDQIAAAADAPAPSQPHDSALDYISALMRRSEPVHAPAAPAPMAAPPGPPRRPPVPAKQAEASPTGSAHSEPERAQWERISLDPDIELHIRRPLTRQHNKRVERLISIARQLLEEE